MSNIRGRILKTVAKIITAVAIAEAGTASFLTFYQPKMPKELQK